MSAPVHAVVIHQSELALSWSMAVRHTEMKALFGRSRTDCASWSLTQVVFGLSVKCGRSGRCADNKRFSGAAPD
jgi:hypothetical protein